MDVCASTFPFFHVALGRVLEEMSLVSFPPSPSAAGELQCDGSIRVCWRLSLRKRCDELEAPFVNRSHPLPLRLSLPPPFNPSQFLDCQRLLSFPPSFQSPPVPSNTLRSVAASSQPSRFRTKIRACHRLVLKWKSMIYSGRILGLRSRDDLDLSALPRYGRRHEPPPV